MKLMVVTGKIDHNNYNNGRGEGYRNNNRGNSNYNGAHGYNNRQNNSERGFNKK